MDSSEIQGLIIRLPVLLFAVTCHEVAHGYTAYRLGDSTARDLGRLTLNPIKHLDFLGVLAFFFVGIGWAKPVPVNPLYLKDPRKDMMLVSLAGPGSNLALAVASVVLLRMLSFFAGSMPAVVSVPLTSMLYFSIGINIALAIFNLFPLPPLDGSKVLMGFLPEDMANEYAKVEPFGLLILVALLYTGVLSGILWPMMRIVRDFLLGIFF